MRKISIFVLLVTLATTTTTAQESQESPDQGRMFVLMNYVTIKHGMEQAFMAAMADHLEWHKSTNDTHYYSAGQVITGPRTGQFVWAAGPLTGAMLDDYRTFEETDVADWSNRGGMQYIDGIETQIYGTIPGLDNPPPPDHQAAMVNIYEIDIEFPEITSFMQSVEQLEALEAEVGHDDYHMWTEVVSGNSLTKRHYVQWVEGWDDMPGVDPVREAELANAAGGEEAYVRLRENMLRSVKKATIHTIQNLPDLSFLPEGQ
ncbi:MAG: hypothetical protein VYE24_04430 [Acidobacteriota bacterium]|nr:hypothetical protein [Acidobacteriota bacterium]